MATRTTPKGKAWMDDHDDAHFSGNPAYRKHRSKKRVAASGKIKTGIGASGRTAKYVGKKTARKRVAGK